MAFGCVALNGSITRLLLDINRSPSNLHRWSRFSTTLTVEAKARLHTRYFEPHLEKLKHSIEAEINKSGRAVHLSLHTFTRSLYGQRRATDIGLLFDPSRPLEVDISKAWREALRQALPKLQVDENQPYHGTEDGLTTLLRTQYPPDQYAGIELEVCNDFFTSGDPSWLKQLAETFPLDC
jgi:predicted N-formylglutamate amidohydrolase